MSEFEKWSYKTLDQLKNKMKEISVDFPLSDNTSILKKGIAIGNKTSANRILYQPMEGCDGKVTGEPDELTIRRYDRFAKGGAGVIWFEAVAAVHEGRANPRQLYLTKGNIDSFKNIVSDIKETCIKENGFEPIVIMQLTHSGRYSKPNGTPEPLIAYNSPIFEKDNPISTDRIVTDDYLKFIEVKMGESAKLSEQAGFDGVDIKACHRYLNCELLSAFTRKGEYGGSFENRTRFYLNSVNNAKASVSSDYIVTSRLNIYDGFVYPYGFGVSDNGTIDPDISEAKALVKKLGLNFINITMGNPYFNPHVNRPYDSGGYIPPEHPLVGVARMYNLIGEIKKDNKDIVVASSGLSYLREFAANAAAGMIDNGYCDLAGFGRLNFAYPDLAKDIIKDGKLNPRKVCIACGKCTEIMRAGSTPGCVIRDPLYTDLYKKIMEAKK